MKKVFLLIGLLGTLSFAQENVETDLPKIAQHELSLNLPITIFAKFPMFSYEYLSSPDIGFGGSAGFAIGDADYGDIKYQFVPFVRWYFLNSGNETSYGRRFFIEANGTVFGYEVVNDIQNLDDENKVDLGLGMGLGYKYVNSSNWIGTMYLGVGRTFSDDNPNASYPHVGINIGKRF